MKIRRIIILCILIFFSILIMFGFLNTDLKLTKYDYYSSKIPKAFNGYKIIQISDLHHKNFGTNQSDLIKIINSQNPDIILLTGDIVDEDHTDMTPIEDLLKGICNTAPIYYVTGNHELELDASEQYGKLQVLFDNYGVVDLDDKSVELTKGGDSIYLTGLKYRSDYIKGYLESADSSKFNILMYHGSNNFNQICKYGYDLVFSGHSHGGIVRLPFIGGLIGNKGDGLLPNYCGGVFENNNSTLISSCGLGDSDIPRFNNPPEVVMITIHRS